MPGIWRCEHGHSFDESRDGYLNLLLAHQKNSREPGYSKDMLDSRRRFFDRGYYEPLADQVASLLAKYAPADAVVVDAGCGEGYYMRKLSLQVAPSVTRIGIDISKPAVKLAAKVDRTATYAVGGSHRLPLLDASVDVLLSHFSPISPDDFARVVKPGAILVTGGPASDHLLELKELFYDDPHYREANHPYSLAEHFEAIGEEVIGFPMHIEGVNDVRDLVRMTPFYWSVPDDVRARAWNLESLDTQVDVTMRAFRRR